MITCTDEFENSQNKEFIITKPTVKNKLIFKLYKYPTVKEYNKDRFRGTMSMVMVLSVMLCITAISINYVTGSNFSTEIRKSLTVIVITVVALPVLGKLCGDMLFVILGLNKETIDISNLKLKNIPLIGSLRGIILFPTKETYYYIGIHELSGTRLYFKCKQDLLLGEHAKVSEYGEEKTLRVIEVGKLTDVEYEGVLAPEGYKRER